MIRVGPLAPVAALIVIGGCASKHPPPLHPTTPAAAVIFRDRSPDIPHTIGDLQLFEHPLAHVYARTEVEAREAVRWMVVQRRNFILWFPDVELRQVTIHVNDGEPLWYSAEQPATFPPRFDEPLTILTAQALEALGRAHADRVAVGVDSAKHDPIGNALGRALMAGMVAIITEDLQRIALWQAWLDEFEFADGDALAASPDAVDLAQSLLAWHVVTAPGQGDVPRAAHGGGIPPFEGAFPPEEMPLPAEESAIAVRLAWDEFRRRSGAMSDSEALPTRVTYVRD
jgi:hypothetical protein